MEILSRIKALGVRIAVDDFGTGYSSLAYINALPLDTLKIDKSFVTHLSEDSTAKDIATAIIALAHAVGINLIAEGIESAEQLRILRQLGCDRGQGYFRAPRCRCRKRTHSWPAPAPTEDTGSGPQARRRAPDRQSTPGCRSRLRRRSTSRWSALQPKSRRSPAIGIAPRTASTATWPGMRTIVGPRSPRPRAAHGVPAG